MSKNNFTKLSGIKLEECEKSILLKISFVSSGLKYSGNKIISDHFKKKTIDLNLNILVI